MAELFCLFVNSDAPECRDYNVLSQPNRHQSFGRGTNSDSNLVPGWYRFQSSSYSRMVDNCIQVHRCTTDITGWLKGGHPTFKDGIVDREACFHGWENCCYRIVQIRVRECQGFYVYELNPSPEGRYRYCAREWTVSGPSVWLEELWIVQKGFHVEDVVRAKTTHVIINNDIAIRKWFILT